MPGLRHLLTTACFLLLYSGIFGQSLCVQSGTPTTLASLLTSNLNACGPGSTVNITSGGTTGVSPGNSVNVINPTSAGVITAQIVNSSGNNCGSTVNINAINTAFTYTTGPGCFGVTLTAAGGNNSGCTYSYQIDGTWHNANSAGVLAHTFNSGGSFNVRLRVTCGACTFQSAVTTVNVNGVIPALTFKGDTYLETSPVTTLEDLTGITVQSNNTNVVAYCVYVDAGAANFQFPLQISDASQNSAGATNYSVTFDGSTIYNASTPPNAFNVTPVPSTQGYHNLVYSITSGGCTSTEIFRVYIAQNSPLLMSLTPGGGFNCIGNNVNFSVPATFGNFPDDTEVRMIIACNATLTAPLDTLYSQTWSDPDLVPDPIQWAPTQSSCGCTNGNFYVFAYASNPCYPSTAPGVTPFAVNDATAQFPHQTEYCQGNYTFTWPSNINCTATHQWQLTSPSGVTTNLGNPGSTSVNANFNAPGTWTLTHNVISATCGNDTYTATMCVSDNINGNVNWGSAPASNSSVCFTTPSMVLQPVFTPSPGLFLCPNQTITYNWSVSQSACSSCDNTEPCYSISGNGNPNPTITLSCACTYTITCTVTGCGPNFTASRTFTLVAPPTFNVPPACLTSCLGQSWTPDGCITINTCNGGAATTSTYSYNGSNPWTSGVTFPAATSYNITLNAATSVTSGTCPATQTITVVVSPPPTPTINGPTQVCAGTPFSLTASACSGVGQWSLQSGGNLWGAPTNEIISSTTSYVFTCTIGGCEGSANHTVQVFNQPAVSIVTPAVNPCSGGPATYSANVTPAGTYTYQWSLNNSNTATSPTYTLNPNNNDLIGLSVGYGANCTTPIQQASVSLASVNVILDCSLIPQPLCQDMNPFQIPVPVYPSGVVQDSVRLNNVILTGNTINPASLSPGNQSLIYYYHDATGCSYTSSCSFTLSANQTVNITPAGASVCSGIPLNLTISPAQPGSITWSSTPCPACINSSGVFLATAPGNYQINVDGFCVNPAQTTVSVNANPTGNITSPLTMCATQSLQLSGSTNPSQSNVTWTVNGIATPSGFNPLSLGIAAGSYPVCMNITDPNNCSVNVCQTIVISDASTPLPTLSCNPVFNYYCFDMPCVNTPTPVIPSDWTLNTTTVNGIAFNQSQICPGVTPFTEATHNLAFSLTDAAGCPMTLSCSINVHDTLDLIITYPDDLTICETETISFGLNTDPGGYGSWSCSPCPTCISSTGVFTPIDITSPTVYTITYDGACVSHTSVQLTVNPKPNVTSVSVASLCINEELTLEGVASTDVINAFWQWNGNNISGNLLDPNAAGLQTGATYAICFQGINQYGCVDTDCFDLLIEGLPGPVVIDNDGWHCLDTPFSIPVNNAVNYTVVFTNTNTGNSYGPYSEAASFSFPVNGNYSYVVTIASTSGCEITQNGTLDVLDNPIAAIDVSAYNECSPLFNLINNSTGDDITYTWSGDLPITGINNALPNPSSFIITPTPVDAIYEFQLTVSNNCSVSTDEVSVYFQAPPQAFLDTLWIGANNCSPFCLQLDADCPSTGNLNSVIYSWPGFSDINSGNQSLTFPDLSTIPTVCFETQSAVEIPISVSMTNNCGQSSASITAVVIPQQVEAEFTIPETVCPGNNVIIIDNSFPDFGATVSFNVTPSGQGVFIQNGQVVVLENAAPGDYIITQTISGCGTDSESHTINVGTTPQLSIDISNNIYCTGEPVVMTASVSEPIELNWNFGDGISAVGYSNIEHIYYEAGTYDVTVSGISLSGCPGSASGQASISGSDDFMSLNDSIFCGNNSIKAFTTNPAWQSIIWTLIPDDNLPSNPLVGVDEFEHYFVNNSDTIMSFQLQMDLTNLNGCISRDIRTIVVKPNTTVELELEKDTVCTIPFANTIVIMDYNPLWNYDYYIPDALDIVNRVNRIDAVFYSSQTVTVTARNQYGCSNTGKLEIECTDWPYYVPNIFTPDNDGINDVFRPIFSNEPLYYKFSVFDRWGEVVFSTSDPEQPWTGNHGGDGEYFVPNGVYVWQVEYQSNKTSARKTDRGHVSIVR